MPTLRVAEAFCKTTPRRRTSSARRIQKTKSVKTSCSVKTKTNPQQGSPLFAHSLSPLSPLIIAAGFDFAPCNWLRHYHVTEIGRPNRRRSHPCDYCRIIVVLIHNIHGLESEPIPKQDQFPSYFGIFHILNSSTIYTPIR